MSAMRPAMYWKRFANRDVICHLCPHQCILSEGEMGQCNARQNIDGTLVALTYGHPIAIHIDPVEKKPLYHFFPGTKVFSVATSGCNLHCMHCQNWEISQQTHILEPFRSPEAIIEMALASGCQAIAFTYSEPLVWYEYLLHMAQLTRKANLKNILVSAGYINPKPLARLIPYIDAANIDLKSFSDDHYRAINGARLQPVLDTIAALKKNKIWIEITQVLIPGFNTNEATIKQTIRWLLEHDMNDVPLHYSRFHPAYQMADIPPTPSEIVLQACHLAQSMGMKYVYSGNINNRQFENTNCPQCQQLLIERNGYRVKIINHDLPFCNKCHHIVAGCFSA